MMPALNGVGAIGSSSGLQPWARAASATTGISPDARKLVAIGHLRSAGKDHYAARSRSVLVEHLLNTFHILGLCQRELEEHARLGGVQLTRRHQAELIVVDFVVPQHDAQGQAGA